MEKQFQSAFKKEICTKYTPFSREDIEYVIRNTSITELVNTAWKAWGGRGPENKLRDGYAILDLKTLKVMPYAVFINDNNKDKLPSVLYDDPYTLVLYSIPSFIETIMPTELVFSRQELDTYESIYADQLEIGWPDVSIVEHYGFSKEVMNAKIKAFLIAYSDEWVFDKSLVNQQLEKMQFETKMDHKEIAAVIAEFLLQNKLYHDTRIYWSDEKDNWFMYEFDYDGNMKTIDNIHPSDHMEFYCDEVTITTEGPFYQVINYGQLFYDEFAKLLKSHGYSFEVGHSWSINVFRPSIL